MIPSDIIMALGVYIICLEELRQLKLDTYSQNCLIF